MNRLALNTYNHDPFVSKGSYLVKDFKDEIFDYDAGSAAKLCHDAIRIVPQSSLSNVFNGSAQIVDWQINRNQVISHFETITLRLTITNVGANAATLLAAHFGVCDYFEIMVGGGTVETVYSQHLFWNELYQTKDDEHLENSRILRGYSGGNLGINYSGPANLAVGASRSFYIEIPNVFSKGNVFVSALEQTVGIRAHFLPTMLTTTSLATTIAVVQADLYIHGRKYTDDIRQKLMARYRSIDHVIPYFAPQRTIISGQTISDTNKTQVKLTEFGGMYACNLVVYLVPNGAVRENLYNFRPLFKLELLRNGQTVANFQDCEADYLKQMMAYQFGTTAVLTENVYNIPFSIVPVEAINHGVQRGVEILTNNDVLQIQMPTGLAGVYDVYAVCYRFCNGVISKNGTFQLLQITQ